jgi:hypothetical protein
MMIAAYEAWLALWESCPEGTERANAEKTKQGKKEDKCKTPLFFIQKRDVIDWSVLP